jgi:hypothetical protein
MNMENSSILGIIGIGLVYALVITLPILVIIVVVRSIRRADTPHQKEMRRLLGQIVNALEENNRLLDRQIGRRQLDEKREHTPPAG